MIGFVKIKKTLGNRNKNLNCYIWYQWWFKNAARYLYFFERKQYLLNNVFDFSRTPNKIPYFLIIKAESNT